MIKAKKSLGQNFLVDEDILNKIVSIVKIKNKSILEIGPGTGNLTSHILKNGSKKLIVVEKDKLLSDQLSGPMETPEKIGEELAENMLSAGAKNILADYEGLC